MSTAVQAERLRVGMRPPEDDEAILPRFRYTPRLLVDVARWARAHPEGLIEVQGVMDELTGEGWLAWFRRRLQAKINRDLPRPTWRKLQELYQTELGRDCQALRSRRLITQLMTPELRGRFASRITLPEEM